jgi:hypothetical protein
MKLVFGTYRPERLTAPETLPDGTTKNGPYYPAQYLNSQYADWNAAGLTNCVDRFIPEERYTGEIAPGIPKLTRFIIGEYDEMKADPAAFSASIAKVGAKWDIKMFATPEEAAQWVRDNTDLVEEAPGKFLIHPAGNDPFRGEFPAKYLIIA